jgi:AraC-like DNA-binding protein
MRLTSYSARQSHALRRVQLLEAALCRVYVGSKHIQAGTTLASVEAGEWVVLPAHLPVHVANKADADGYLSQMISIPSSAVAEHFRAYGASYCYARTGHQAIAKVNASSRLDEAWRRLLNSISSEEPALLQKHLLGEVLMLLGLSGALEVLRVAHSGALSERVRQLFSSDLEKDWQQIEVAAYFCMSAATLRRRLNQEHTTFTELLEETRLSKGLDLLQTSTDAVSAVALKSGYASPSRFTERFSARFGITPSALRRAIEG